MRSYRVAYIEDCSACHGMGKCCEGYEEDGPIYGKEDCKVCEGTGRQEGEMDLIAALRDIHDHGHMPETAPQYRRTIRWG